MKPSSQPVLHVYTTQPWNASDLALLGSKMPRLREDAEKCAQLFSNVCAGCRPNWGDTQVLLRELFQPAERVKVRSKDAELA